MGILTANATHTNTPEWDVLLNHVIREHRAHLYCTVMQRGVVEYHIEGNGIPHGEQRFMLQMNEVVKGVYTVEIFND